MVESHSNSIMKKSHVNTRKKCDVILLKKYAWSRIKVDNYFNLSIFYVKYIIIWIQIVSKCKI